MDRKQLEPILARLEDAYLRLTRLTANHYVISSLNESGDIFGLGQHNTDELDTASHQMQHIIRIAPFYDDSQLFGPLKEAPSDKKVYADIDDALAKMDVDTEASIKEATVLFEQRVKDLKQSVTNYKQLSSELVAENAEGLSALQQRAVALQKVKTDSVGGSLTPAIKMQEISTIEDAFEEQLGKLRERGHSTLETVSANVGASILVTVDTSYRMEDLIDGLIEIASEYKHKEERHNSVGKKLALKNRSSDASAVYTGDANNVYKDLRSLKRQLTWAQYGGLKLLKPSNWIALMRRDNKETTDISDFYRQDAPGFRDVALYRRIADYIALTKVFEAKQTP